MGSLKCVTVRRAAQEAEYDSVRLGDPERGAVAVDHRDIVVVNELVTELRGDAGRKGADMKVDHLRYRFSLGWIKFSQKRRGDRFIASDFHAQPDFVGIAEANGCYEERIEKPSDIKPALNRALEANGDGKPAVLEFIVDGWDFAPGFESFYRRLG